MCSHDISRQCDQNKHEKIHVIFAGTFILRIVTGIIFAACNPGTRSLSRSAACTLPALPFMVPKTFPRYFVCDGTTFRNSCRCRRRVQRGRCKVPRLVGFVDTPKRSLCHQTIDHAQSFPRRTVVHPCTMRIPVLSGGAFFAA